MGLGVGKAMSQGFKSVGEGVKNGKGRYRAKRGRQESGSVV